MAVTGRPPRYEWNLLLDTSQDEPCGRGRPCPGKHAPIWELEEGADFTVSIIHLQGQMYDRAFRSGLKCHTRRKPTGLQVQFYIPEG